MDGNAAHTEDGNYAEIGRLLRSARERLRMSPDQASRLLHIRVRYLEALEEGRLAELPGLTYTRGYLQAYATFLDLDKEEILRRFEEVEAMIARKNFFLPQAFSKEKTPSHWMVWGGPAGAIMLYIVWALLIRSPSPTVSLVDTLPAPESRVRVSAEMARQVACLRSPEGLYPTCTLETLPEVRLVPLGHLMPGPEVSVMEFAARDFEPVKPAAPAEPVEDEEPAEDDELE